MKTVVIVTGYSGAGKSTFIDAAASSLPDQISAYHIATPFKDMMRVLWGVDVDDRQVRATYRPNGRETVGDLMASAFLKFREWDKDVLMPGLRKRVRTFAANEEQDFLLVDGVRTVAEVEELMGLCSELHMNLQAIEIVRKNMVEEPHKYIQVDIYSTLEYLDSLYNQALPEVANTSDSQQEWAQFSRIYWLNHTMHNPLPSFSPIN